jgi:hypothetical protein
MSARANGAGLYSIILCTAHGFETVQIAADGKPAPDAPLPDQQNSTCPICAGFHAGSAFTAPSPLFIAVSPQWKQAPQPVLSAFVVSPRAHFSYVSRAPPVAAS